MSEIDKNNKRKTIECYFGVQHLYRTIILYHLSKIAVEKEDCYNLERFLLGDFITATLHPW
ncbi:MAG: hypothetical protein ACFE8E_13935 [Candidatus Hodarchaeota archaeon]